MPHSFVKDIVENPHRVFTRYFHYWNFLLDSYEGGVDYTESNVPHDVSNTDNSLMQVKVNGKDLRNRTHNNLFQHPKERVEDYQRRVARSYYYNFNAPIIDIYTDHLFRSPITEDFANIEDIFEQRRDNLDRKGSSIAELRKEMAELAQLYGHAFAVVDMPQALGEVNMQQRIDNDSFPYVTLFSPQKVINWSLDAFGRPFWVLLCEVADSNPDPRFFDKTKDNRDMVNYRLWTRNEWVLYDGDFNAIDDGVHGLGVVPIVPFYNKVSKKVRGFLGISEIADISFISRDVYNLCSELGQIISDQTFSFLAIQGKSQDYGGDKVLSVGKGLIYPENANVPQYVAPPEGPANIIMQQIDRQINKMFQLAKLEGGSAHQNEQIRSQSGISKAFDFHQTNSALSKKANNLNDAELKIWDLIARWEGRNGFEGMIEYPDDFSVSDINDDITEAFESLKLDIGKLAQIEMNKSILKKKFPKLPDDELQVIIDDMEVTVNNKAAVNGNGNGNPQRLRERLNLFRPTNETTS